MSRSELLIAKGIMFSSCILSYLADSNAKLLRAAALHAMSQRLLDGQVSPHRLTQVPILTADLQVKRICVDWSS